MDAELTFKHLAHAHACGLPDERLARVAARRAFVEMKMCFMRAAADIDGNAGLLLQRKVRMAREVIELWRLRGAIFAALPVDSTEGEFHRQEISRQLDYAFPEGGGNTAFVSLSP